MARQTLDQQIEKLLDVNEAARVLAVHPVTAYRWARQGKLPAIRVGPRLLRFDPRALDRFLQANRIHADA